MKKNIQRIIALVFIWIGFVLAISFMEAWLKFQAPGISRAEGLSIGILVFYALNKVEITLAVCITILLFLKPQRLIKPFLSLYYLMALLILVIQTLWLLPSLEDRAHLIIAGIDVPDSRIHLVYIVIELVKIISLGLFGKTLLNQHHDNR